eukprot:TRINITY_DN12246_c0_g1_i3.p4 TRINITY_DN12246_c0_g1~~TRINITY_DN12246_c0_g1_i3.p4  ORF type:complete len:111 (-),score=14.14 TRINITY_DN12246_c0_g1_i3:949-1254(-)
MYPNLLTFMKNYMDFKQILCIRDYATGNVMLACNNMYPNLLTFMKNYMDFKQILCIRDYATGNVMLACINMYPNLFPFHCWNIAQYKFVVKEEEVLNKESD